MRSRCGSDGPPFGRPSATGADGRCASSTQKRNPCGSRSGRLGRADGRQLSQPAAKSGASDAEELRLGRRELRVAEDSCGVKAGKVRELGGRRVRGAAQRPGPEPRPPERPPAVPATPRSARSGPAPAPRPVHSASRRGGPRRPPPLLRGVPRHRVVVASSSGSPSHREVARTRLRSARRRALR